MDIFNNLDMKSKLILLPMIGLVAFVTILTTGLLASNMVFIIVTAIVVLIWLVLTFMIIRSLSESVKYLANSARAMAEGNLNINFKNTLKGELGLLENSLTGLTGTLQKLNDDCAAFSHKAEKGQAQNIHILNILTSFENGDFKVNIPVFEGENEQIGKSIKLLGAQLDNLNTDLKNLIVSAAQGQLGQRVDASAYHGDWVQFANFLNQLLDAVSTPIYEAVQVMDQVSRGDFSKKMTGNYSGDFARIKASINATISNTSHYINEITRVLTELAGKNLSINIDVDFEGDFSAIKDAMQMIVEQLNEFMQGINTAAEQVAIGAKTISDSSMTLAEGANMQAATVDNLTETITQVDEKTSSNAKNAAKAEKLSGESHNNALKGNTEMQNMLDAMEAIKASSSNISTIIRVISDIAFQTGMLALNAAVEAARAGEHGRGFAVVAEEVRNLASKSDEAAKETTSLIEESIEKVNQGTAIATATAQALEKIVSDTNEVSGIISGIAAESNEQSEAIGKVHTGTNQIADVIQSNSSTSEETAAAAQELSSQSELLRDMISVFRLRSGGSANMPKAISVISQEPISEPIPKSIPKPAQELTLATRPKSKPVPVSAEKIEPEPVSDSVFVAPAAKAVPKSTPTPVPAAPAIKAEAKPIPTTAPITPAIKTESKPAATPISAMPAAKAEPKPVQKPQPTQSGPDINNPSKVTDLAAAYLAESSRASKSGSDEGDKNTKITQRPTIKAASAPSAVKPAIKTAPDYSQGMVSSNAGTVVAPSASHVYDKKDYGKY